MKIYYIDTPDTPLNKEEAEAVGVLTWALDADNHAEPLDAIKKERGYTYEDTVDSKNIPEFEKKIASFAEEHLHDDEEIRFFLDGSGYFDVRDQRADADGEGRWIRMECVKGDLIVLPPGIYHRFVVDEKRFFLVKRLFVGDPVWTPHPRKEEATESRESRQGYKSTHLKEKTDVEAGNKRKETDATEESAKKAKDDEN
eukprot:TRINITY_DN290_c0_g1_i1.p1 TRINITY_DN290_c0_g1~~TRINITY_DN290_c0_g1_i1.p1  ORF type:complete len:199 (-),score=50.59 TRINITY_DN290_c0_g1_i1:42-638(-)